MSCENMKSLMAFSLLSTLLVKISVASSEAAIDDSLANDDIFANTYSDLDPFSTPDDGFQGSPWDESLITDADPYSGFLADADIGCSGTIEPPAKRRRDNYCDPQVPPADLRLALPQNPFETLEQKNRINLDLDPIRFPGGAPQFTQMDNLYCGSSQFVVCDSGRENDKKPKGNGKYRLQNAKRGMFPFRYVRPSLRFVAVSFNLLNLYSPSGIPMRQPLFNLVL